jgi:hypothetical protein
LFGISRTWGFTVITVAFPSVFAAFKRGFGTAFNGMFIVGGFASMRRGELTRRVSVRAPQNQRDQVRYHSSRKVLQRRDPDQARWGTRREAAAPEIRRAQRAVVERPLFSCQQDMLSCKDAVLCPVCFLARVDTTSQLRWERDVLPYVRHFRNKRQLLKCGCTDWDFCWRLAVVWPLAWLLFPFTCFYDFVIGEEQTFYLCHAVYPAYQRTMKHSRISPSHAASEKCHLMWCCPCSMTRVFRQLRFEGINPGLTWWARLPAEEDELQFRLEQTAPIVPNLGEILEHNTGARDQTSYVPSEGG